MAKQNCWEFKECGREFNGGRSDELGVCPAYHAYQVNKIHGGKHAGRCCWAVTGTICGGKVQGIYALKSHNCEKCDFYLLVLEEEGENIVSAHKIIHLMNTN
ncbi:MAG: hypothetical protein KAS16_00190 [Thermoplasmata archaeon]|nr:hypothetical protein [Thermoplasmata archaeon]